MKASETPPPTHTHRQSLSTLPPLQPYPIKAKPDIALRTSSITLFKFKMVRTAFVALACSMMSAASALEVTTPSQDLVVVADR